MIDATDAYRLIDTSLNNLDPHQGIDFVICMRK